jgi:uncharacterized protein YndB with AHSA1/START domain
VTHHQSGDNATTFALPSDREIALERVFDAPRELVFRACVDRSLIPRWWGPRRLTTAVDVLDVKPGGAWRFIQHDAAGNEYAFHGEYREVGAPDRLVYTFEFEGMPGHVILETVTFEEHDGRTTMTVADLFDSVEDRDGMLQSGMEEGARESNDRLGELLAELG